MSAPLHWQEDVAATQYDANMALLDWAQRTRRRRLLDQGVTLATEAAQDEQEDTSDDHPVQGV